MTTRKAIREEFAALLSNALTGSGKPVQEVFAYLPDDFGGKTPVVAVGSGGSERNGLTYRGQKAIHALDVFVFVLHHAKDASEQVIWSERDAEDTLDAIEELIAQTVVDGQRGSNWHSIDYDSRTKPDMVPIANTAYLREVITLKFSDF